MVKKFKGSGRTREGGIPAVHKQDFNAHTTGGDLKHEADHILMNPQPSGEFAGADVQTALSSVTTFLNDRLTQIIENKDFTGSGTSPALEISGQTTPTHYKNCTFTATSGSDSWALVVGSSTRLVFENCTFNGPEGQIIKCINTGANFINCYFSSGSGTALTNPQAILGYGYTDGDDDSQALQFTNCRLVYGSSNIEASTAPELAIVELGGSGNARFSGRVVVNALYVMPENSSTGVHNYSTILIHTSGGDSPHIFRDLTFNALDNIPTNDGTLSGLNSLAKGALIEVAFDDTDGYTKTTFENLHIINVKNPTSTHNRNIIFFERTNIYGFKLEGSAESNTGVYQGQMVRLIESNVTNFEFCIDKPIAGSGDFIFLFGVCNIINGRIKTHDVTFGNVIDIDTHNNIQNVIIFLEAETTGRVISSASYCTISGCTFYSTISSASSPLFNFSDNNTIGTRFINNQVLWEISDSDQIASFGESMIVVGNFFGNQFTLSGAPSVSYPSSGVGSDTLNLRSTGFLVYDDNLERL